ncbi:MAG TPA: hypothetical protein VIK04_16610 [Solirubrobacteraceae bacterium]
MAGRSTPCLPPAARLFRLSAILLFDDLRSWCGQELIAAAGPDPRDGNGERAGGDRAARIVRRLTRPPLRDLSDEAPRFSRDGRWIMFVRSQVVTVGRSASSRDTIELVPTSGIGSAVPIIDFTSDDISFYDHFGFPAEIDWYQPH